MGSTSVRRPRLRISSVGFHLHRVNQVGKLDRVLNKKYRDIVPDQVEIPFTRIKFHRETANVSRQIHRAAPSRDSRETSENRSLHPWISQKSRPRHRRHRTVWLKVPVSTGPARVNNTLRDPFVIEVRDLLSQHEILEQRRPPRTSAKGVLIVRNRQPLVSRKHRSVNCRVLVCFPTARLLLFHKPAIQQFNRQSL